MREKLSGRGRTLLLEHIPNRFGQQDGVLFIVFLNGDVFMYPLMNETSGDIEIHSKSPKATLISNDPKKSLQRTGSFNGKGFSHYQVHDVELEDKYLIKFHKMQFFENEFGVLPPKKIILSANQKLLLAFGILFRGQNCVVVYQILENGPNRLKEIFFDYTMSFIDVCFTPDSRSILVIPSRQPHLIFMMKLALIRDDSASLGGYTGGISNVTNVADIRVNNISYRSTTSSLTSPFPREHISFEPRIAASLTILGPAVGVFGLPLEMTHIESISSNPVGEYYNRPVLSSTEKNKDLSFYFITWNDEGLGEYTLWHVVKRQPTKTFVYRCIPRLLHHVFDHHWLEEEDSPKIYILQARFYKEGQPLGFLVLRENFGKPTSNGIGIQMVHLFDEYWNHPPSPSPYTTTTTTTSTTSNHHHNHTHHHHHHHHSSNNKLLNGNLFTSGGGGGGFPQVIVRKLSELPSPLMMMSADSTTAATTTTSTIIPTTTTTTSSTTTTTPHCSTPPPLNSGMNVLPLANSLCWFKLVHDDNVDAYFSCCLKWTRPLFLGSLPSLAVIVQGSGLFELVDHCYASKFQDSGKIDSFSETVSNFCQPTSYRRYWTTNVGKLHAIITNEKQQATKMYEWPDFVQERSPDYWDLRMFGSKFGYFIKNLKSDSEFQANLIEQLYVMRKRKNESNTTLGIVVHSICDTSQYAGLHLYRCWQCKRALLKPLQCAQCKSVVYCSGRCQRDHWLVHKQVCTDTGVHFPHRK